MSTRRRRWLEPASAAALLGTDWILHSLASFFELEAMARIVIWGAIFCGAVVLLVETVVRPSRGFPAVMKGLGAAGVILWPGPWLGTLVAACALAWATALSLATRWADARR